MRGQRHHRDGADLLQREIEIGELHAVRQLHDEAVERTDAEIEQVQREIGRARIELLRR